MLETLPNALQSFLKTVNFLEKWKEIKSNTTNPDSFTNRFFRWFNAFLIMKYVHFARNNFYPDIDVKEVATSLLKKQKDKPPANLADLLLIYRKKDRGINVDNF